MNTFLERRRAMMVAASSTPDYISDGLVLWLDGIIKDNTAARTWTDLVSGYVFSISDSYPDDYSFTNNVIKDQLIYTPIGNNFEHNTVGYCSYSRFGDNILFFQNFGEIYWCDFTGSSDSISAIKNVNTLGYLRGMGSQNKLVISFEGGKDYPQFATLAADPSGQLTLQERLKIWSEEDKQDTLISGTNIKTINGESILGSGNLVVEGGTVSLPATIDCVTLREPTSEELSNLPQAPSHKVYTNTVIDLVTNQLPKEFWIEENQRYNRMTLFGLEEYSDTYIAIYTNERFLVSLDGSFMILLEEEES